MRVFGDIARLGAKRHPDKHAVVKDDAFLTFGQLNSRANQLANGLLALGVRPGDRIAILSQNCLEFVVVASGVAKCGAVLVPVNFRYKKTELVYLTRNCEPKLLFFSPDFKSLIADVVNEISPSIRLATLFGTPLIPGLDLDGIIAGQAASEPAVSVDPDSALMITYTSGTTGTPKGVFCHTAPRSTTTWEWWLRAILQPTDITLVNLPLFHTGGMHALLQPTLFRGGTAVIMAGQFDPEHVPRRCQSPQGDPDHVGADHAGDADPVSECGGVRCSDTRKDVVRVIGDHSHGAGSGHGVVQVPVLPMVRTGGDRDGVGTPS